MNFDDLKSAWNAEKIDDVQIPSHIEQLKRAQHPLEKLKQNIRRESYMQLVAIVILGFVPQLYDLHLSLYVIYYAAYVMLIAISGYYLFGFQKFYKQINNYAGDTKDSLLEIYYEFRLNIERYHSFGFLLLPFALVWIGVFVQSRMLESGKNVLTISSEVQYMLIVTVLIVTLIVLLAIQGWTKWFYGRYVKQLKSLLDELKEES